jgi:hypothetical protein
VDGVFLSIFQGDLLRKLISSVWMTVEKNQWVRWTQGIPEIHFHFLNFILRPFLSKKTYYVDVIKNDQKGPKIDQNMSL